VRTEEAATAKVLLDHFPMFTEEDMYITQVDGRTLNQTIREDRQRMQNGDKLVMGNLYYAKLRDKFQGRDSVWAKLTVADEAQPEGRQLFVAIMARQAA
jgi:hypothetical protein